MTTQREIKDMKVHPFADRWPMMRADELNDLAADIKTHGQLHPIVTAIIDGEEVLIDGRNRQAACQIAGVKPFYKPLNGQDPVAYIISSNAARRQMMKGALAMVVATQFPEHEVGGRGLKSAVTAGFPMVPQRRLNEARTVIAFAPELVDPVIMGSTSLDAAYAEACKRKNAADTDEKKIQRLVSSAPDLADLVKEERMQVPEAIAALDERERRKREVIEAGRRAVEGMTDFLANVACIAAAQQLVSEPLMSTERLLEIAEATDSLSEIIQRAETPKGA